MNNPMKSIHKKLIFLYIFLVIAKIIISYFIKAPTAFSDEYILAKIARGIMHENSFSVHGFLFNKYAPLYPMLLSISYFFTNMNLVYFSMKIINAFLYSLAIFPAYIIAKDFTTKKSTFQKRMFS